jgi:hypothetical protein
MGIHEDYDSQGLTRPVDRPVTGQEKQWIASILQTHPAWADVMADDLSVDGECTCGCRTVHFRHPAQPQNPKRVSVDGENIGEIWIDTDQGQTISISLHARHGTLCELEVVNESGGPVPQTWREVSRKMRTLSDPWV